jgi:hypothetical protein
MLVDTNITRELQSGGSASSRDRALVQLGKGGLGAALGWLAN